MGGTAHSPSAKVDERPDVVAAAVERNPAAIAYVGYAYGSQDRSLPIAEPACGLVLPPTPFLIKAEEYPLARRLFLYTTTKAADLSMQFVQFAQGTRAQERAAKIGYVNLLAEEANDGYTSRRVASAPAGLAGRAQHQIRTAFEKAIVGAHRLSITFRFQLGSDSLDSRGQADVARLASAIKAEYPDRSVTLIGHSSTDGEFGQNVALSLKRAIDVADKLKDAHVRVARAIGVGPVSQVGCPVAGGSDAAENDINRRVEVWVR
jgi:phosphate transport system substrate-binding protein